MVNVDKDTDALQAQRSAGRRRLAGDAVHLVR